MKSILYIGQYTEGTTSKMRAEILRKEFGTTNFQVIDTHIPFFQTNKIWRSLGFRFKKGPLVQKTNAYIQTQLKHIKVDLIWVDKGIFINSETIKLLKNKTNKIIHFTPDMAFYENYSSHFVKNINNYDLLITTKTKEIDFYLNHINKEKLYVCTQGFSKDVHKSWHSFEEKDNSIVFIGLAETSRIEMADFLLDKGFKLKIVGQGWEDFVSENKGNSNLVFIGKSVFGDEYAQLISSVYFALGLLSKRFPELHTTRTFEIPACRTALISEKNEELSSIYSDDEVVFYSKLEELPERIAYFQKNLSELKDLTKKAHLKVHERGFDYESIIKKILTKIAND